MGDMRRIIRKGDRIAATYTGKLDTGQVFDTNVGREPFIMQVGKGDTIVGFDEALIGLSEGEHRSFTVPPEKGYGQFHEKLVYVIPREQLGEVDPKIGTELLLRSNTGNKTMAKARITKVEDDKITLDMNHALAGKNLTFEVTINQIF